jgi:hypothetical protein
MIGLRKVCLRYHDNVYELRMLGEADSEEYDRTNKREANLEGPWERGIGR